MHTLLRTLILVGLSFWW